MSKTTVTGEAKAFRKKAGFSILGKGLQDLIRYFFGGNAMVAIVVLILISAFLAKEAFFFFPRHLEELRAYRETGQEYVGYMDAELKAHRKITSQATQAYNLQIREAAKGELALTEVVQELRGLLREKVEDESRALKKAEEKAGVMEFVGGEALEAAQAEVTRAQQAYQAAVKTAGDSVFLDDLERGDEKPTVEDFANAKRSVVRTLAGEEAPWLSNLEAAVETKQAAAAEKYLEFGDAVKKLVAAQSPLEELWSDLRTITAENRKEVEKAQTAPRRKKALEDGASLTDDATRKAEMLARAAAIELSKPDPEAMTEAVYAKRDEHLAIRKQLLAQTREVIQEIPKQVAAKARTRFWKSCPKWRPNLRRCLPSWGSKRASGPTKRRLGCGIR